MTQQAFYLRATKGHQLRGDSEARTWLFTTLQREFLRVRREEGRFPYDEPEDVCLELPSVEPLMANNLDATRVLQALARLAPPYRAPVTLFYLGNIPTRRSPISWRFPLARSSPESCAVRASCSAC